MVQRHRARYSIPIALLGAVLIRHRRGRWPSRVLGTYLLHLLIDILTHTRDPRGPRPLWLFFDMAYDGVGWAETLTRAIQSGWH
jgi:hypothetical protein